MTLMPLRGPTRPQAARLTPQEGAGVVPQPEAAERVQAAGEKYSSAQRLKQE